MNKMNFKTILYILIGIVILGGIVMLFVNLLPFILIAVLAIWLFKKIKGKREPKKWDEEEEIRTRETYYKNQTTTIEDDEFDTSNAIDVDYQNVDDK